MAITKIHPIKATLALAIRYITKPEKTDEKLLVSCFNCYAESAAQMFMKTKENTGGRGDVLARHLIQSFLPGETTPEKAYEIGLALCESVLKKEAERPGKADSSSTLTAFWNRPTIGNSFYP